MDGVETSEELHFFYDAQSRPAMVEYNGAMYSYLHNLQGDIIGIVDAEGNLVVEYKYDVWGKPVSITGSLTNTLGDLNPFRYRGYVYDEETGLYYLCSRYYNPVWGRFINSDIVLGKVGAVGSHNQFAYCGNNPVAMVDPDGQTSIAADAATWGGAAVAGASIGGVWGFLAVAGTYLTVKSVAWAYSAATASSATSSSAATVSQKRLSDTLTKSTPVDAKTLCNDIFNHGYYFAFVNEGGGRNILSVLPVSLTKEQAKMVLYSEFIYSELLKKFNFNSNQYGIYTPTHAAAESLAADVYGSGYKLPHVGTTAGDYYQHFHDGLHDFHIWFGVPTIVQ